MSKHGFSFSWKRAFGISAAKGRISRQIGIPLTRSGRERKYGRWASDNLIFLLLGGWVIVVIWSLLELLFKLAGGAISIVVEIVAWPFEAAYRALFGRKLHVDENRLAPASGQSPRRYYLNRNAAEPPPLPGSVKAPSPKQKAYLDYLGLAVPATSQEASALISQTGEDDSLFEKRMSWSSDRLRLHPGLYAEELVAAQESAIDRHAERHLQVAQFIKSQNSENAALCPVKTPTVTQARALIAFLDAKVPGWDATLYNASEWEVLNEGVMWDIVIPAATQRLPELLKKGRDPEGMATAGYLPYLEEPAGPAAGSGGFPARLFLACLKAAGILLAGLFILSFIGVFIGAIVGERTPPSPENNTTPTTANTPPPAATPLKPIRDKKAAVATAAPAAAPTQPPTVRHADAPPMPTPVPAAAPTPHPAAEARALALRAHPELGQAGSPFNRRFRELYEAAQRDNPSLLTQPNWPVILAQKTAGELAAPRPVASPPTP